MQANQHLTNNLHCSMYSEPGSDRSGSIWGCNASFRSPLIRSNLCPYFILAMSIVAVAISSPYLFVNKLAEHQEQLVCVEWWNEGFKDLSLKSYTLSLFIVFYCVPFFLLTILYSIVVFKLKSQKIPDEQSRNTEEQRAKRNRNVLKMSVAIVLGFALCWLPWSVMHLLGMFVWGGIHCGIVSYDTVFYFL